MYPSKENFPHKEKRRVRISDGRKIFHQRKQPANRALSFSLSFFLFLFFSSFSRCHRFLISRFINLGFSNFIHRLIILLLLFFFCAIIFLDIFPSLSLSLDSIYIYIYFDPSAKWCDFRIGRLSRSHLRVKYRSNEIFTDTFGL